MSSDFETYEQDFGTITAEVTNKIGRIPKLSGGKTVTFISWSCAQLELVPIQLVFLRWGRLTVVSVLCVKTHHMMYLQRFQQNNEKSFAPNISYK